MSLYAKLIDENSYSKIRKSKNLKELVFLTFYSKDRFRIFDGLNDPSMEEYVKNIEGYSFLLIFRQDSRLGLIGGSVENGSLEENVLREVKEETPGFFEIAKKKIENEQCEKVHYYYKKDRKEFLSTYFLVPLSVEEYLSLKERVPYSYTPEAVGFNFVLVPTFPENYVKKLFKDSKNKGIYGLMKNNIVDKSIIVYLLKKFLPENEFKEFVEYFKIPRESYEPSNFHF